MAPATKLWVDDLRAAPAGWTWAKDYDMATAHLSMGKVVSLSLDHDLGEGQKTGYDIAKWMVETKIYPPYIFVHSLNSVGAANIRQLLEHYAPSHVKVF